MPRPRGGRHWSVRARTTAAAVAVLLPVLTAAGVVGAVVQRGELERAVVLVAEEQARTVARDPGVSTELGGEESLVQVVDASGAVVSASPALAGDPPLAPDPGRTVTHTTVDGSRVAEDGSYVVAAVPMAGGGYVTAARGLETVEVATESTLQLLVIGIPGVLVLTGVLCWVLAGRALRPVEDLRVRASGISSAGDGDRLPLPGTGDEIERLAETLNAMLGRIESSAEARRQFVADASHELRSPVAAVRAVMEVAPPGTPAWEEARRDVLAETERMARLVDAMLLLARHDAAPADLPRREVDLAAVVAEQATRPRRHPVRTSYDARPLVLGDPAALATAVGNLLDNADRHARSGVWVRLAVEGERAVLTVLDDGDGIPESQWERVFERFVRLDEARSRDAGGAGLGLAIVRTVARDHGGEVVVAVSEVGARLVLRLPASGLAAEPAERGASGPVPPRPRREV